MTTPTIPESLSPDAVRNTVRDAYGDVARLGSSCCAPSCCAPAAEPKPMLHEAAERSVEIAQTLGYSAEQMASVPDSANLGLGCGNPLLIASLQPGDDVLDLGSGPGFDCLLASEQVGPTGTVIGVDMTPDMLDRARATASKAGASNVRFRLGAIEALPVADTTVDVIMSNCVINLSPEKDAVFREAFRVLRPGGRLAIKDILATAPIPADLQSDFEALTGCIAGAATVQEIEASLLSAGFASIQVCVDESSRAMIDQWMPGRGAGAVVASASITAIRPEMA